MLQAIEFLPLELLSEVLGDHQDSISQIGSCLGSVRVHSLTLSYTPRSMWCDSWAFSWPAPLQPLCLGREPKARVATVGMGLNIIRVFTEEKKIVHPNSWEIYVTCRWMLRRATTCHLYKWFVNKFFLLEKNVKIEWKNLPVPSWPWSNQNSSVREWGNKSLGFWLMWSKLCHRFCEAVVELPLHKAKALTYMRMHSMMVLKKFDDSPHLKLGKDVMMSSQMIFTPSKPNPL
jgi:hypothetical protein